jgi:hypothetical protein
MTSDDIVQRIRLDVPEAPGITITELLRWTMAEMCDFGNAWIHSGEPVVVAANTLYAELAVPPNTEAVRVVEVLLDSRKMEPGRDYLQTSPSRIEFTRAPKPSTLYGRIAVKPLPGSEMPAELVSAHNDALRHGTLHKLLMLPQPWQNTQLAVYHERLWNAGISRVKQLASCGYQIGGARIRMRRFI